MCGYVGYISGATQPKKSTVESMLSVIRHRGPDSQEIYMDDTIGLGFSRLSIIDVKGGTQPIFNEDKNLVLLFNGEIYNYKTLREELKGKGHSFYTQSDSEVIVHGYEEYGVDILHKLRGMFSFVIWDKKHKKLFGARDHFGIKPFYYYKKNDVFMFGSEIKSFLPNPLFEKQLRNEKLYEYITFSCLSGEDTFFKNVYKLLPGHYIVYNGEASIITKRYFNPLFDNNIQEKKEYLDELKFVVNESIQAHTISDVPVGSFLSGGVDSSYVASFLSSKNKDLETYTIGFEDKRFDESEFAEEFSREMNIKNTKIIISDKEYLETIQKVQYHLDEPLANPSANLLYLLSKRASEDLKVVLSGEGADEMFAGYNVYKEPFSIALYTKIPLFIRKAIAYSTKFFPYFSGKNFLRRASLSIEERYRGNSNIFSEQEKELVLSSKKDFYDMSFLKQIQDTYIHTKKYDDVTAMQYFDINFWMVQEILLKADKMSMANSLELRVPLLDRYIFDFARTIPTEFKVNRFQTKLLFRKLAETIVPKVSAERKKAAFPSPLPVWIKQDNFKKVIQSYIDKSYTRVFFDSNEVNKLFEETLQGKHNVRKIWTVFTFLVWYDEFFIKR